MPDREQDRWKMERMMKEDRGRITEWREREGEGGRERGWDGMEWDGIKKYWKKSEREGKKRKERERKERKKRKREKRKNHHLKHRERHL